MAYLRTSAVASFGTLCAGALVLAACAGKTLSLGTNSTQSAEVAPSQVTGTVTPCDPGSAHPNVCCTAGPDATASCVVYPDAPFTQCAAGAATYPDPRSCCSLDGSGACAAPPPSQSSSGGSGSSGGGCAYVCPPGMYAPPGSSGDTCCATDNSGATTCTASGGANGSGTLGCGGSCSCAACEPDSGSCPPCNCPNTPCPSPAPSCGTCPVGWQTPQGQPDLCCTTDPNGDIECFSQALPPGQSTPSTDAGGPQSIGCGGAGSEDGGPGACGCQSQTNGHSYAVNCDPGTNLCTCTVDNGAPTTTFADDGNTCMDATALFTSCGFPVN